MTPALRPPPSAKSLARRAAITLLITGAIGLAIGAFCLLLGMLLPQFADNPDIKKMLEDLRRQTPLDPAMLLLTDGVIFTAYAIGSLTIGIGLFRGTRPWILAGTIFCSIAGGLLAIETLANLAQGNVGGALAILCLVAPHGLALWWLLQARNAPTTALLLTPPPAYLAMQDYYLPAVEPVRHG